MELNLKPTTPPEVKPMNEVLLSKFFASFAKLFAAIVGALLALVLSKDIATDGTIKIGRSTIIKFVGAVAISLYGGEAVIAYYALNNIATMAQGAIMLGLAIFGLLVIGILYRAVEMMNGKPISEIIQEIKSAFLAMLGGR